MSQLLQGLLSLRLWLLAFATAAASIVADANAAIFIPLGDLSGGVFYSRAHAVSADGQVVVGESVSAAGTEAFRWQGGTMTGLGDLPGAGFSSAAFGVSANGSVIVGQGFAAVDSGTAFEAFRVQGGSMSGLGFIPNGGFSSIANGVSADGSLAVGNGNVSGVGERAFQAQNGAISSLAVPNSAILTAATGVSANGTTISGYSQVGSQTIATQWLNSAPSLLPGIDTSHSTAGRGISGDGSVIVGDAGFSGGTQAVSWKNGQLTVLGDLPGGSTFGVALAASESGSLIVGRGQSASGFEAFIWTDTTGMLSLKDMVVALGVSNVSDWTLEQAEGLSANGRVIVGWGTNPQGNNEAWLINLDAQVVPVAVPEPNTALLFLAGIAAALAACAVKPNNVA